MYRRFSPNMARESYRGTRVDARHLKKLLRSYRDGTKKESEVLSELRDLPFEDLGYARVDHHRALRCGRFEVILGAGKTPEQVVGISRALRRKDALVLATRLSEESVAALREAFPEVEHHEEARAATIGKLPRAKGLVAVVSAGTSDRPVAQEAVVTARCGGAKVALHEDVGVAGIHRTLRLRPELDAARAVVVVAGMEGALPSVVAGLVSRPVIAVPTSVGYGASFGGVAALLGMLNSCASGVSVVNIDNGFGAGYQAALINER
jgi:NCAIR mutase (PurE)-related protein